MKTLVLVLSLLSLAPAALAVDVEGYVYTIEGTPVANAAVTAGTQRTTTSDAGHFKVTAPADSIVAIEVRAENLPPSRVLALAGDPPLTITLMPQSQRDGGPSPMMMTTATAVPMRRAERAAPPRAAEERDRVITGVVRIGKRAIANAPVTVARISEIYTPPVTVTTDEKGRYRLDVASGRYIVSPGEGLGPRIRSINEGRMYADTEAPIIDTASAKESSMDVELVAAPLITGRVLDAEEKPVPRADVIVVMAGRAPLEFFHHPIVRTLPDGRFAVPAPPFPETEKVEVVVTPPRHSPTRSKAFALNQVKELTITLPKLEKVTVRITDRERKPLAGASLTYAASDETTNFGTNDVLLMPHMARRRIETGPAASVDLFLAPGTYELAASAPKYQPRVVSQRVTRATTIDIALEPGHAIRGRVHRGETPVAGVQVMIRGGNVPRAERGASTDEKGEFVFDALAKGTYSIALHKADELIDKMLTVEAPAEVDVDLPPVATLRGRIVDAATREPVREFLYSLEPVGEEDPQRRVRGMQRGESAADGTFSATVPTGTYRIIVAATGFIPSEPMEIVVSPDSKPVEIALGRGATIAGRITDEEGKPVPEAQVMIARDVGEIARSARMISRTMPLNAQTGADGTFTITGAEPGPAQLITRKIGYVLDRRAIDVEPETRVDVTLSRGISLSGVVTLGGKPVAGAEVGATTSAVGSDYQHATTDERGRFTLHGLVAARYMVSANRDNHSAQIKDVDPSQRRELVIELEGAGSGIIFGTVTGIPRADGKSSRGSVYASSGERGAEGAIDANGNFRIENAPAGTVDVVANVMTPQGTRTSTRKRVELAVGQSTRVDLDLTPGIVVTGRVMYGASRALSRAHVTFNNEEMGMSSTVTRDDGTYEVGLPGPGRYHIFANAEELISRHFQTVREFRSSETFDIHMFEQTVEGTVVDAVTRQPIEGAFVTLVAIGMSRTVTAEAPTGANGRFTMVNTASGPHVLIASAHGYAHRSIEVTMGGTDPLRTQFELTPVSELRIRITDARTATPLEAHLTIADERGTFLPIRPARTPDGGEFVFSLAPGKYRLVAITPGYKEKTLEVTAPGRVVVGME